MILQLFKEMEPDDLVDIVQSVNPQVRNTVWESLDDDAKRETLGNIKHFP